MNKEDTVRSRLQTIAKGIEKQLPREFGFILLVPAFGGGGALLYVANITRADSIQAMREFIAVNMEERVWQQEMPQLELEEEFELWWKNQLERAAPQDLKSHCRDAFIAGRMTA